jgi:polysaccharide export outer membrane protein
MSDKNASFETRVADRSTSPRTPRLRMIVAASLLASLSSAPTVIAQASSAISTQYAPAPVVVHPLQIGKGDVVSVTVFDTPSLSFQDRVDEEGFLRAPVLGPILITGLTTEQASRLFEEKLRTGGVMLTPSVTVQDTDYATQGIVLLGQVRSPGTYTLPGPHTLYDALSSAGGVTDTAGAHITITHRGDLQNIEMVDVSSPNFSEVQRKTKVFPGDTIFVSKAEVFYVLGDVGRPGSFYMQSGKPVTILNALALASGDNNTAKAGSATIKRQTSQGSITIPFNLKDIKKGKSADFAVLPDDIIIVPHSELKTALLSILPSAATSAIGTGVTVAAVR